MLILEKKGMETGNGQIYMIMLLNDKSRFSEMLNAHGHFGKIREMYHCIRVKGRSQILV